MEMPLRPLDINPSGWEQTTREATEAEGVVSNVTPTLAIPLDSLTTVAIEGTGVFDVLMKAMKLHLQQEYDSERITGKEYATVYLGALTQVLQTSTQFLMNVQQVHLLNAQIGLVRQQTVTELSNTCDSIPVGLGFNYIPAEPVAIDPLVTLDGGATWL